MNTRRRTGAALCFAGVIVICLLAIFLPIENGPFAGMTGVEQRIQNEAQDILVANGATGYRVDAAGRTLNVQLTNVGADFDREQVLTDLRAIDGVRDGKVELVGDPSVTGAPSNEPTPVPATPVPATPVPATPVPATAIPATPVPATPVPPTPEPSPATPEPAPATPTPEPTATPEPAPPTLAELVADFDGVDIDFESGSATLTAIDTAQLDDVAILLQGQTGGPIQVQAHTDNVGDPDVNLLLSAERADAVANYLIDQGVDASLLTARGFGSSQPIADNDTEQGRADNRRVAFVVEGN